MLAFEDVVKDYHTRFGRKRVLDGVSFTLQRGDALAVIGRNGAGKSTLLRLLTGIETPSSGRITRSMSISWPIGFGGAFQSSLTGADNARFIARIHGRSIKDVVDFVNDFAELGSYYRMPVKTYSSGMQARLAFAISLAIDFDCYVVDEVTAAGDSRFRERCRAALEARRTTGTLIMVSHDPGTLREHCSRGALLEGGKLVMYDDLEACIAAHESRMLAVA